MLAGDAGLFLRLGQVMTRVLMGGVNVQDALVVVHGPLILPLGLADAAHVVKAVAIGVIPVQDPLEQVPGLLHVTDLELAYSLVAKFDVRGLAPGQEKCRKQSVKCQTLHTLLSMKNGIPSSGCHRSRFAGSIITMPKAFVIHIHSGFGPTHYDLMLEQGQALATWQLSQSPQPLEPGQAMPARKLPDHRRAYLTYQGPVSQGRGQVAMLDKGAYEPLRADEAYWEFRLSGRVLIGKFCLRRSGQGEDWTLERMEDPHGKGNISRDERR